MKKFYFVLLTIVWAISVNGQIVITSGSTASNLPVGSGRDWTISGSTATASPLSNGQASTDYLFIRGFHFSSVPNNAVISSFTVWFTRGAGATAVDSAVRLVVNGQPYYSPNTNAAVPASTWPTTPGLGFYFFDGASLSGVTGAQMKAANFGIAIAARRTANNITATVNTTVNVIMTYTVLAPLILTDFTLNKNADNHIEINFATSSEENVDKIFIERSSNGKDFEKLFTITPKGAPNVYTRYKMTDKTPLQGNNYYRIAEVDKNGRWYYYITKLINVSTKGSTFNAYYNGSQVIANISSMPGRYEVMLTDLSGIPLSRRTVDLRSGGTQVRFDAPGRTGIYLVTVRGNSFNEVARVPVTK